MGVAASRDNDDLADNLVKHGPIVSKEVELVFRLVDRGRFFPSEYVDEAYRDNPFKVPMEATDEWIPGKLHISAPSMYATVLEKLDLRPGHAFLNIGSGTGWLSTAAGFLIGGTGINHGVEIHENLIKFAEEKLADTLMAYTRTAESSASSQTLMACQFADLLPPTENDRHDCLPPLVKPPSLADLCRKVIRESLRAKVMNEYPVFMRSIADDPEAMESDSSVTRPESNADMPEGDAEGDLNIVRHPIRVELFRNLGAARIRLESLDRRAHTRNRDARMRDVVTVQLQDGERQHAADGEDGEHDEEVGAGMFVFADEGPPSDDEELDEHNRMGLQWLNAILGFERDSPARRNRDDEEDRARSASPGDSSSDTSVADEAAEAEESGSADGLTGEPENDERSNADSGNHVNGEHGSSSTSSDSTPLLSAEGRGDDEEASFHHILLL
ncbi:unnamed protein product [Nippostrongylus brasiliensis]|uniref:Protein-L-isoaspartate(D-aspartate) O-methyltransferase n=1 Tax=Nippostrongylus brasiliensis TaxID=27835 RepID=A0A0N4XV94_NIPBR|nr:unnamed protein product [Nippostrongylus brasiliensis]